MIEIIPGTLRDITYVAANMRAEDRREIFATALLENATQVGCLSHATSPGWSWVALVDGNPEAAFGLGQGSPIQPHIRHAWAYGTNKFRRCIPAMTRFMKEHWPAWLKEDGVTRVECRSIHDHDIAHRWLIAGGATHEGTLRRYGVNGEDFDLFAFILE